MHTRVWMKGIRSHTYTTIEKRNVVLDACNNLWLFSDSALKSIWFALATSWAITKGNDKTEKRAFFFHHSIHRADCNSSGMNIRNHEQGNYFLIIVKTSQDTRVMFK